MTAKSHSQFESLCDVSRTDLFQATGGVGQQDRVNVVELSVDGVERVGQCLPLDRFVGVDHVPQEVQVHLQRLTPAYQCVHVFLQLRQLPLHIVIDLLGQTLDDLFRIFLGLYQLFDPRVTELLSLSLYSKLGFVLTDKRLILLYLFSFLDCIVVFALALFDLLVEILVFGLEIRNLFGL